jgi:hypothetical protein
MLGAPAQACPCRKSPLDRKGKHSFNGTDYGVHRDTIVPVRFNPEDRKRVETAAKASNKNVSEWIRSTLAAAIGA